MPAGLLLAAGAGRRYGGPKALARTESAPGGSPGELWVERTLAVLRDAGCRPLVVVLGAAAADVRSRAVLPDATLVDNPRWATGLGSSLRAGLAALAPTGAAAVVVMPVDTPGVTVAAVRRLAALVDDPAGAPDALAVASYGGRDGHPVLLGRRHWAGAAAAAVGDSGARAYLRADPTRVRRVPCDDIADGADVDRPPPR